LLYCSLFEGICVIILQVKVLPFRIPKDKSATIHLQIDDDECFYDKLHAHDEFQLTLIEEGSGTFIHGAYVGPFGPGDLFLVAGGTPHLFRSDMRQHERAFARSIFFSWQFLQEHLGVLSEFEFLNNKKVLAEKGGRADGQLSRDSAILIQSIFSTEGIARIHAFFILLDTLLTSSEWLPFKGLPKRSLNEFQGRRLDQVFEYTLAHFAEPISLASIAAVAHMNVSAFCRYFKLHTRKSYVTFLNEYRVQQACQLLAQSEQSVYGIALEVGFNNISNFNRQFKKCLNCTPNGYRKQLRSGGQ